MTRATIAAIAHNVVAARPNNSRQWVAGEVADLIAMRREYEDNRQTVWQETYDTTMEVCT